MTSLTDLSLRTRVFLFFVLMAAGAILLAAMAMTVVWLRAEPPLPAAPLVAAALLFAFLNTGLVLGIWLLFDEHVSKAIDQLSTKLRLRAHSAVEAEWNEQTAQYLGDLAPAAQALSNTVHASMEHFASNGAEETALLRKERERLTALLSEVPIGTVVVNSAAEVVLYDAQAAAILARTAPPRLRAPLAEYFDPCAIAAARSELAQTSGHVVFALPDLKRQRTYNARLKALGDDGEALFIDIEPNLLDPSRPRPMVFDFELFASSLAEDTAQLRLSDLCMVAFDTETTGLSVESDDIVQIAAQRIVNGRLVESEVYESYVNPGRPIPPASTRIHGVRDADVADAPGIEQVCQSFHQFARGAALVAHNAPFDIGLLRRVERRAAVTWDHPVLDTVLLSAVVFGTTAEHSLDALCERLSITIPVGDRHTAMGDARATAEAVVKLLPLLQGRGIRCLAELLTETRRHGRLLQDLNPTP